MLVTRTAALRALLLLWLQRAQPAPLPIFCPLATGPSHILTVPFCTTVLDFHRIQHS